MDTHITGRDREREGVEYKSGRSVRPKIRERHPDSEAEVDSRKHRILLDFRRWWGFGWTIWRGRLETVRASERATFSSPNIGIPFYEFQF